MTRPPINDEAPVVVQEKRGRGRPCNLPVTEFGVRMERLRREVGVNIQTWCGLLREDGVGLATYRRWMGGTTPKYPGLLLAKAHSLVRTRRRRKK